MKNMSSKILLCLFLIIGIGVITTRVDAYTPVTYTCCINYTFNDGNQLDNFDTYVADISPLDGVQLDGFENLSNWTVGGTTGASQQPDTINFKEGSQGLEMIAKYGNEITWNRTYSDKIINNNFSTVNNFAVWVYIYNLSTFYQGTIYISSTTNWSKYLSQSFSAKNSGWNKIIFDKNNFKNYNNESWNNIMRKLRIDIIPHTGQNTNVTFDDLRYNVTVNDWSVSGLGTSMVADNTSFKEGSQAIKLITTSGNTGAIDKNINNDFSKTNNFVIWAYFDNASNQIGMQIYLTSTNFSDRYFVDSEWSGVKTGWNKLVFNKNNFKNNFNESWNNVMKRIRLRTYPIASSNLNVTFDDLRYNLSGKKAKLIITFDDAGLGIYSNAYPVLKLNNQSGVAFVVVNYIIAGNNYGTMNLTNIKTMQDAGWDISSHLIDHIDLTTVNDSTMIYQINGSYDWLVNNNFQKSAGFFAYPYGRFNDNAIDKVKKRYILARGTQPEPAQQHYVQTDDAIQYIQRVIPAYNSTSVQELKDQVDDVINSKLLGILYFHEIVDSNPTTYQYLKTDFQNISDYIKSRNSDIDVITYSDYVIPNIKNFTPIINKTTRIYSNGSSFIITNNKYDEYMPNMTVNPMSDSIDIHLTSYNESGGLIKFNESSQNNSLEVSYTIGDRIPGQMYSVNIYWENGTRYQDFDVMSNDTGYINYNSKGFDNSRYQEITPFISDTTFTVTLPTGYTFLRFNASNSTVTNLEPDGQNSLEPIFILTNNGNIKQNFSLYINETVKNITTYASLDNNYSNRFEINTMPSTIPNLAPGSSQNLWMTIDAEHAPAINTNKTLMINNNVNNFRFIVWGDTKWGVATLTNESRKANNFNPLFTIYTGDLVDCDNPTNSTCFANAFPAWKNALNGGGTNIIFNKTFAIRGNHDNNSDPVWQSEFNFNDIANNIGATNYEEPTTDMNYSFDLGNWHFVGLDGTQDDINQMSLSEINWLDNDLTAAEKRGSTHAIVFWHWPIYYTAYLSTPPNALIDVLNRHSIISAGFFGHNHLVSYTHINSSRISNITHPFEEFISGSTGAELHNATPGRYDYWLNDGNGNSKYGFLMVDVSGNDFTVSAVNIDGSIDKTFYFNR